MTQPNATQTQPARSTASVSTAHCSAQACRRARAAAALRRSKPYEAQCPQTALCAPDEGEKRSGPAPGALRCTRRGASACARAVPSAKQRYGCVVATLTRRAVAAHAPFSAGAVAMASPPPVATLRLPDGREVCLPVLYDASGALFVDVRRLQPDTGAPSLREAARLLTRHAQVSVRSTRGSAARRRARPRRVTFSTACPSRCLTRAAARLR
jgi:hypothetical protein